MIQNIPNKFTKELFISEIDTDFKGKYDFFYLPIDMKNNCNVGYAFINFIDLESIRHFYDTYHGKTWPQFNSKKICKISYARL